MESEICNEETHRTEKTYDLTKPLSGFLRIITFGLLITASISTVGRRERVRPVFFFFRSIVTLRS